MGVLETSFWTAAYKAEAAPNALDFYTIVVPRPVELEILRRDADFPRREYPEQALFRHLRSQMRDPPDDAPPPLPRFGPGEAAAIPLALHLGATLLINDYRAAQYAGTLGIRFATVPGFVVRLYRYGVVSRTAARHKLERIATITHQELLADARRALGRA